MIRVDKKPEPGGFENDVRRRGRAYLRKVPHPSTREWSRHAYWTRILPELHKAYGGICAYSCHWIPYDTGSDTVEHFEPKSLNPMNAYEWGNYRLVCGTLNGRKSNHTDVLDPFELQNGTFILDFPSLLVKPNPNLDDDLSLRAKLAIDRLGLNDEGTCLKSRLAWVKEYCLGLPEWYVEQKAPFIMMELRRQNLVETINQLFFF